MILLIPIPIEPLYVPLYLIHGHGKERTKTQYFAVITRNNRAHTKLHSNIFVSKYHVVCVVFYHSITHQSLINEPLRVHAPHSKTPHLVVVVDNLARVDDGEVGLEVGHLGLRLGPDEHILAEVVLPRELGDDTHVLSRLGTRPAVTIENVPGNVVFHHHFFSRLKKKPSKGSCTCENIFCRLFE